MIAFLISAIGVRGGTEKQFLKLIEFADKEKIDFKVITFQFNLDKTYPEFSKFKDKIYTIDFPNGTWIGSRIFNFFKERKLLKALVHDANAINIHDGGFEKYITALKGRKIFWQINDLNKCFQEGVYKNHHLTLKGILLKKYILLNKKLYTEFIVNVSKNSHFIEKHFKQKARVFYCGIDSLNFIKDNLLSFENFENKKIYLLSSGVLFPYRNYETQIKVVERLVQQGYNPILNIFGSIHNDYEYYKILDNLINLKGLNQHVKILGQIEDEKFLELHKNSDLFLFINIDQSWGLAVFEAMSCGIPVIVSQSVGATEILTDGENAVIVDPIDDLIITQKILEILSNKDIYRKLSENSVNFAKLYTWDKTYCYNMLSLILLEINDSSSSIK